MIKVITVLILAIYPWLSFSFQSVPLDRKGHLLHPISLEECIRNITVLMHNQSSCSNFASGYNELGAINDLLQLKARSLVRYNRRAVTVWLSIAALEYLRGDFVETGVYKGGTAVLMMRVLMRYDKCNRKLYAFDSFEGLPAPQSEDEGALAVGNSGKYSAGIEVFMNNLRGANAWDESRIVISKGWFNETCAKSPVKLISFLRLDGDMFASTWDAINALYDRVVQGGYIYVDDYGSFNGCNVAIDKFRTERGISSVLHFVPEDLPVKKNRYEAVWWRKD